MRPVLIAGNLVAATLSARTDSQLPQATVELTHSRAPLMAEPLPAAAIEWATALTATALPEGAALSAALFGARRGAGGDRGGAVGERLGRGAGPLRAAAARRTGLRPRSRELRGQRLDRRSGRGQPALGPCGQRRRGRALCRQAAAAAALRPRRRAGELVRHRAGARSDRPLPDARFIDPEIGGSGEARSRLVDRLRRAGGLD